MESERERYIGKISYFCIWLFDVLSNWTIGEGRRFMTDVDELSLGALELVSVVPPVVKSHWCLHQ